MSRQGPLDRASLPYHLLARWTSDGRVPKRGHYTPESRWDGYITRDQTGHEEAFLEGADQTNGLLWL